MEQLLVHLLGDFVLQTSWMALNKNKKSFPCLVHVLIYTSCFLLLTTSWKALLVIGATHFIIDRFPIIVKKLIWWKNHFPSGYFPYSYCDTTGYYDNSPYNSNVGECEISNKFDRPRLFFVTCWLYIITDNFLHLTINYFALKYL